MVIASIDLKDGKVVQLKQGRDLILERDDPEDLAAEFNRYGEVALIDLDAALGSGSNDHIIKNLLSRADCRVGGGIKTVERAKELLGLGAKKIIIGSLAFKPTKPKLVSNDQSTGLTGQFAVNRAFLSQLATAVGREHIIVAVDARNEKIVVDGWKTDTGLDLYASAQAVEEFAGELLFTCTEREGTLTGIDLNQVSKLRASLNCRVTVAGGVNSLEEITAIAALGCDVQLGMALYQGKINLAEAFSQSLDWTKAKVLPIAAQALDGQILRLSLIDQAKLVDSLKNAQLAGPPPENRPLELIKLRASDQRDSLLASVRTSRADSPTVNFSGFSLELLQDIISQRFRQPTSGSYTATLDDERVREKLMEEAAELREAAGRAEIIWECADLWYFTTVLITRAGVKVADILAELQRRHLKSTK